MKVKDLIWKLQQIYDKERSFITANQIPTDSVRTS